jgi:hypothetical protein
MIIFLLNFISSRFSSQGYCLPLRASIWLVAASACCAGVQARDYWPWQSSSFGGGGFMQGVVFCGIPGILHTYSDVGGIWKSTDNGATWRIISGGLPAGDGFRNIRGLQVNGPNPSRVLCAVGNQWTSQRGVFTSWDGGVTWTKRLDARFLGNEAHRSTGSVFASTGDKIFVGTAGDGLWSSTDGGMTWSLHGLLGYNITDLDALADGGLVVCAAAYTLPNGANLQGGFFRYGADHQLAWQGPEGPEELVEGENQLVGIFQSARLMFSGDGGANWEDFSAGLPVDPQAAAASFTSESRFRALAAKDNFFLLASARGTFYRRGSGDNSWTVVVRDSVTEEFEGRPWWGRIQTGKWQHFGAATSSLAVDPLNPDRWWMTDWYGLYETTDAGATWTLRINGIESAVVHCLEGSPSGGRLLAGLADNGPLLSNDDGTTFAASIPFSNLRAVGVSAQDRVYGTGSLSGEWQANTLWLSNDDGTSWLPATATGLPPSSTRRINSMAVPRGARDTVYVAVAGSLAGPGGVYRSTDSGANFIPLRSGMEQAGDFFQASIWSGGSELALSGSGVLICTSRSTGESYLLPPGESTWIPAMLNLPGRPWDLKAGPTAIHASRGTGGVWTSRDGGYNWVQIYSGFATVMAADPTDDDRLAVLISGGIRWTGNGGTSWNYLPLPPHREIKAMTFHGDRLVVGTNGGGLFFTDTLVPSMATQSLQRSRDGATKIHISQLTGIPEAGENASLRYVDNVSLSGGSVAKSGSWITYRPPDGIQAWQTDSIAFAIENTNGVLTGTLNLGVPATAYTSAGSLLSVTPKPSDASTTVVFAGIPGVVYEVRASSNLSTWSLIQTATADALGRLEVIDTHGAGNSRFYTLTRP